MTENNNSNNNTPSTTTRKPMFRKQHYDAIGKLIGEKIVYDVTDEEDYSIIEAFAQMFAEDNPAFDKVKFRDSIHNAHSKKAVVVVMEVLCCFYME